MTTSSGQTPVTQQTTQTRDPWSAAQPHLTGIMNQADVQYAAGGYTPYTGQTLADLHPWTSQALEREAGMIGAENVSPGLINARNLAAQQTGNYGLSPELQNLYNQASTQDNPYLQGAINQQVKGANAAASGMGRYGSGAHDAAIAGAISPIMAQDYARRQQERQGILEGGLQRAGQFAQLTPGLDQAQFAGLDRLMGLGDVYGQRSQTQLADQIKQYNAGQAYPWEQLARYQAIIGGAGGLGGTQITTSPGAQQPSTLNRVLGGAAAGAGIGGSFGGPAGAGLGAGAGGLLGLL